MIFLLRNPSEMQLLLYKLANGTVNFIAERYPVRLLLLSSFLNEVNNVRKYMHSKYSENKCLVLRLD